MPQAGVLRNDWGLTTTNCDYDERGFIFVRGHAYLRPARDLTSELIRNYRAIYADWVSAGIAEYLRTTDLVAKMSEPRKVEFPNLDWFLQNFDSLVVDYPDQWLAIVNKRVVANASTPAQLRELIKARGISKPFIAHASRKAWGRPE